MPTSSYEIPLYGGPVKDLHGWCIEAVQEGEAWLSAQRPTAEWESIKQLLGPGDGTPDPTGLSGTQYNKLRRIAVELVATLANFRHEGEFKPLWDNDLYARAHELTNLDAHWLRTTHAHEEIRKAFQYGVGFGTGYLYEIWDPHYWGQFRGDIRLEAFAPNDVTFVQLPKDHDIQRAYGVLIRYELPINLAKAIYGPTNPGFAAALTPDRDAPNWLQKGLKKVQQFVSPALRVRGTSGRDQETSTFPTVDVYHLITLDRSMNLGPTAIQMGAYGTNWAYSVPALGDPIPQGLVNPSTGRPGTLSAEPAHTLLFPFRRLTIFSRSAGICYDGSQPWWHGEVPLARIRYNDWAWESLGASVIADGRTMQDGVSALMRGMEDSAAARLDPPIVFDEQIVSKAWAQQINPRLAGVRAAANLQAGKPFELPIDPRYYDVPAFIPEFMAAQEGRIDYVTAITDMTAIAKAQQIPGADTLEKLMEMAGPIVQDRVRAAEKPLYQLGEWRKAYFFQFYTRPRVIQVAGIDPKTGLAGLVDYQYTPDKLIPVQGVPSAGGAAVADGGDLRTQRIRGYLSDFRYDITESGINEIHRMSNKLFFLQLMKLGFPIDWWTFADMAQIANFGPPPQGTNTVMERWVAQQRINAELQGSVAAEAQAAAGGLMGQPTAGGGGNAPGPGGGASGNPAPSQAGPGRPNSDQKPPHIVSKDGGARSTVATS